MKKKKKDNDCIKFLIETSVQRDKITNPHVKEQLLKVSSKGKLYSSFFVCYEFKVSLIKNLIDFYFLVELEGPAQAFITWHDKYQPREVKDIVLLQGLIYKITDTINTKDKEEFLVNLETIIIDLLIAFYVDINKTLVGDFGGNEIVKYQILSRDDFQLFRDLYNRSKIVQMDSFWARNKIVLDKLCENELIVTINKTLPEKLKKIQIDQKESNKYMINRAVGDVVIAVDSPRSYTIISLDHAFSVLTCAIDKKCMILEKKPSKN